MIEYIRGTLVKKSIGQVVVEANGIGYVVNVSNSVLDILPYEKKEVKFFISETSSMYSGTNTWYGFLSEDERELFETIKGVNKIGAKGALDILSRVGKRINEFKVCLVNTEADKLQEIFGFTKQKAEKLVLGLKNKIAVINIDSETNEMCVSLGIGIQNKSFENDAVEALKTLGYSAVAAKKVVAQVLRNCKDNADMSLEEIIRVCLKSI